MKHLRGFNEDVSEDDYVELKDFCESSLAYLLDDYNYGLNVRRRTYGDPPKSDVVVSIGPMRGVESMQWDDISDHFIPFLTLLDRRYDLDLQGHGGLLMARRNQKPRQNIQIKIKGKETAYYTIDDIVQEKVSLEGEIFQIGTIVKSKK